MRKRTSVWTMVAGSALLAASTTHAAAADGYHAHPAAAGAYHATVGSGIPRASVAPGVGYGHVPTTGHPLMDVAAYGPVWAGYTPDHGHGGCGCGHCGHRPKSQVRKLMDKLSSGMDRLLFKASAGGCDCGCSGGAETSCDADCDSACDAMGPSVMPHPAVPAPLPRMRPVESHRTMVPSLETLPANPQTAPSVPTPTSVPQLKSVPTPPQDPFVDDPITSARRPEFQGAGYYQR